MSMNSSFYVPDFDMDEDYSSIPTSTSTRPKKLPLLGDRDEIMELLWENGQLVVQSQNQRSFTRRPLIEDDAVTLSDRGEIRSSSHHNESGLNNDHLFVQEDEMAFWLHQYAPVEATDLYSDVIDPSAAAPRESTVVDSCETLRAPESVALRFAGSTVEVSGGAAEGGGGEMGARELTSSSGGSASLDPVTEVDRKRKGREADDNDGCGVCETPDAKKQIRGSTPAKKSRAAEVHNLSERRRRDRINEKMRALQELIPRCNKSDKASMLDEAIEYLKSLQLQVQMMSMGSGMVPMMFPGVQQFMPPMGMAVGMGMGMEMGMSRPMMPFPSVLGGSALPTPAAAAHMGPRFPVPAFNMPSVPLPSPSNQSYPILKSLSSQNRNLPRMMNFPGPYHQYLGLNHTQLPLPQKQAMMHPSNH